MKPETQFKDGGLKPEVAILPLGEFSDVESSAWRQSNDVDVTAYGSAFAFSQF